MAYADPQPLAPRKIVSIIIVAILHVVVGYAFITGLAYNVVKQVAKNLDVIDVKEPPPPPEKPPPPPPQQKVEPPPVVAPPPIVAPPVVSAPTIVSVPNPPPPVVIPTPAPPMPPPPPPAPPVVSKAAGAKGDPQSWITTDDYPPDALRENAEGRTGISWDINEQGRVDNCQVTSSSGNSSLDQAACRALVRHARYSPALDQTGRPIRSHSSRTVVWKIPAE